MGSQVCTKRIYFWSLTSLLPPKQAAALHKGNHKLLFNPGIPIQQKFLKASRMWMPHYSTGAPSILFSSGNQGGEKSVFLDCPLTQKSCLWHVMLETGQGLGGISRAIHFLIRCLTLLIKISLLLPVSTKFFHKYLPRCLSVCMYAFAVSCFLASFQSYTPVNMQSLWSYYCVLYHIAGIVYLSETFIH